MKLASIKISDFRSILSQEISFQHKCIGLIGLNESGKSNVLAAIRLLDETYIPAFSDRSKISRRFPVIECRYDLEESDREVIEIIKNELLSDITYTSEFKIQIEVPPSIRKTVLVSQGEGGTLNRTTSVNIPIVISTNVQISKLKTDVNVPSDAIIQIGDDPMLLSTATYIETSLVPDEFRDYYEEFLNDDIRTYLINRMHESLKELYPNVIFWKYDEKYLLPSEIQYEAFIEGDKPYDSRFIISFC